MARSANARWGNRSPATAEEARTRLVDAAEECFARFGVAKTTLDDIASHAGVSRATVYRYFDGGRDAIVLAVVLREAHEFLDALTKRAQREATLDDAIVEGVRYTVDAVRKSEKLALLFAPEVAGETSTIAGASIALFEITTDFLRPIFEQARADDQLRPGVEAEDAAEFVLRIILSMLSVPGSRPRDVGKEREFLRTFCAGVLVAAH